jgi:hypothetical protein
MDKSMQAMIQVLRKAISDAEPSLVAKRFPDDSTCEPTRLESLQHALSILDTIEGDATLPFEVRFACASAVVGIMSAYDVDIPQGYKRRLH